MLCLSSSFYISLIFFLIGLTLLIISFINTDAENSRGMKIILSFSFFTAVGLRGIIAHHKSICSK